MRLRSALFVLALVSLQCAVAESRAGGDWFADDKQNSLQVRSPVNERQYVGSAVIDPDRRRYAVSQPRGPAKLCSRLLRGTYFEKICSLKSDNPAGVTAKRAVPISYPASTIVGSNSLNQSLKKHL